MVSVGLKREGSKTEAVEADRTRLWKRVAAAAPAGRPTDQEPTHHHSAIMVSRTSACRRL